MEESKWMTDTLKTWVVHSFRELREQWRFLIRFWVADEYDLMIEQAKKIRDKMTNFIDFLENKRKF